MTKIKDKRVLITGASSGIGYHTAIEFAAKNAKVAILARRLDCLEECRKEILKRMPEAEVLVIKGDITEKEDIVNALNAIKDRWGGIDILVNNAGVGLFGTALETGKHQLACVMDVNFFAPVSLIRKILPEFIKRNSGHIVNISSYLAEKTIPGSSGYSASKAAITRFSEALYFELAGTDIKVTTINPGTTETEFLEAGLLASKKRPVPWGRQDTPQRVAGQIIKAVRNNKIRLTLSFKANIIVVLNRISNRLADMLICFVKHKKIKELYKGLSGYEK